MSYLCPCCHTSHDTTACPINFGTPLAHCADDLDAKFTSVPDIADLRDKEYTDLKRERDGDAESARMMQERLTRLVTANQDLKAQLATAARARGAYLEQLRDASVELSEAQKEIADLKEQLTERESAADALGKRADNFSAQLEKAKDEAAQWKEVYDKAYSTAKRRGEQLEIRESAMDNLAKKLTATEALLADRWNRCPRMGQE